MTARRLRWRGRYGRDWYWLDQSEYEDGLNITELVSPLRYDIVIREDLISQYRAKRALYGSNFEAFFEFALQHPYYVCHRFMNPALVGDESALRAAYVDRIRHFVTLYDRIVDSGFDTRMPIVPKTARKILPTPEGKMVSGRFFMGDGCHRLACLMALGYETLPAAYVRVKCYRTLTPRDGTVDLAHTVPIVPEDYFVLLSRRYAAPHRFERGEELLGYLEQEAPAALNEVLSVIRADRMMDLEDVGTIQEDSYKQAMGVA